jgi:hypothetical protein
LLVAALVEDGCAVFVDIGHEDHIAVVGIPQVSSVSQQGPGVGLGISVGASVGSSMGVDVAVGEGVQVDVGTGERVAVGTSVGHSALC